MEGRRVTVRGIGVRSCAPHLCPSRWDAFVIYVAGGRGDSGRGSAFPTAHRELLQLQTGVVWHLGGGPCPSPSLAFSEEGTDGLRVLPGEATRLGPSFGALPWDEPTALVYRSSPLSFPEHHAFPIAPSVPVPVVLPSWFCPTSPW